METLQSRLKIYIYAICVLLLILGARLAIVQIFYADKYPTKASENRIRLLPILASRGEIYDRNGETLAANKLVYTLSLSYLEGNDQEKIVTQLLTLLQPYYPEVTATQIKEKIELQKYRLTAGRYQSVIALGTGSITDESRQDLPVLRSIRTCCGYSPAIWRSCARLYPTINEEELAATGKNTASTA
jgi:penicillin-binding protein 2